MEYLRTKVLYNDKKKIYYLSCQPKLNAPTKSILFNLIKTELDYKRIHIRRNSIVCY